MQLMGSRNWWFPAWLDRIVPRVDLSEGEPGETAGDPGATPSRSASAPPPPRAAKG